MTDNTQYYQARLYVKSDDSDATKVSFNSYAPKGLTLIVATPHTLSFNETVANYRKIIEENYSNIGPTASRKFVYVRILRIVGFIETIIEELNIGVAADGYSVKLTFSDNNRIKSYMDEPKVPTVQDLLGKMITVHNTPWKSAIVEAKLMNGAEAFLMVKPDNRWYFSVTDTDGVGWNAIGKTKVVSSPDAQEMFSPLLEDDYDSWHENTDLKDYFIKGVSRYLNWCIHSRIGDKNLGTLDTYYLYNDAEGQDEPPRNS